MPDDKSLAGRRINREALERILKRASELQANEVDTTQDLTETELLKLGAEVGIDGRHLRQALYEEASGPAAAERGAVSRWMGPGTVHAGRVVRGEQLVMEEALTHWMLDSELLTLKRRMPDRMVFERQKGFVAEMKRGFGVGGRSYQLAKAKEVAFSVTSLETGYCHVELSADISDTRTAYAGGSVAIGSVGAAGAIVTGALAAPVVIPVTIAVMFGTGAYAISKMHKPMVERTQLALEQVLDRLEHGEIKPRHSSNTPTTRLSRVADEIRRAITDGIEQSKRPRRLGP